MKRAGNTGKAARKKSGAAGGETGATTEKEAACTPPLRELYREGEVPVLDADIALPAGEAIPAGVSAYYRSLAAAYARGARERLLPAAREALLALPEERRRFGFRRFRLTVRGCAETRGSYLLVTRTAVLACGAVTRRREVCEVFRLPDGRLTPPLLFLRDVCGGLPRGWRRFRHAEMTLSGGAATLTTARGRTMRIPLPPGEEAGS